MFSDQEYNTLLIIIREDFPDACDDTHAHMVHILEHAYSCSGLLTGKVPSAAKARALVAQLKSFLQILNME